MRPYVRVSATRLPAFALIATLCRTAAAEPQANAGLLAGIAGRGTPGHLWDSTVFYGGLRGDVVLGRSKPRDFGVGPFGEIATAAFDDLRLGGGVTTHIPVTASLPLLVSAGGFARNRAGDWAPGLTGQVFFGSRSFNYGSSYILATGLVLGVDHIPGSNGETTFLILAQLDGFLLAAPFMLLRGAAHRGD